jgi:hypothetical protein
VICPAPPPALIDLSYFLGTVRKELFIEKGSIMAGIDGNGNGFKPRVVSDVTREHGSDIEEFLGRLTAKIDTKDSDSLLRGYQNLVTGSRAAMLEFERRMGDRYHRAIVRKFRSDIERLWNSGFLVGYAKNQIEALAQPEPLEKAIIAYFQTSHYHVGRSQRFAIPVFPEGYRDTQIACLRDVLQRYGVSIVDSQLHFDLDISSEFLSQYEEREVCNRKSPPSRPYALCGVHGGKDTPNHSVEDSLEYFEAHHRLPFTFKEALSLYTAHPRFLREQERVILLGEEYPSGKYAYISSGARCLQIGLVSLESADAVYAHATLSPHSYHGGIPLPYYGKPSAAALVVDKHL